MHPCLLKDTKIINNKWVVDNINPGFRVIITTFVVCVYIDSGYDI